MKSLLSVVLVTAGLAAGQTSAKPASTASTAAHSAASAGAKLPPGIPPVHGVIKTAFSLRYEDIKIGAGADAEPGKLFKVIYTGYRAADGVKFDSSLDHRRPVLDKDGKPVNGPDGKPQLGEPEPLTFPQGMGRIFPGLDQGFAGMKVGGKRRIFVPWQLGFGTRDLPARGPDHPGIPPKSDLIFDVELVDVSNFQMPQRPGMIPGRPMPPGAHTGPAQPGPAQPGAPGSSAPPAPGAAPVTPPPAAAPAPSAPPQPSTPPQPHSDN